MWELKEEISEVSKEKMVELATPRDEESMLVMQSPPMRDQLEQTSHSKRSEQTEQLGMQVMQSGSLGWLSQVDCS